MEPPQRVRMDKWLWAARLFKTRTLAAGACEAGHVKIDGLNTKPAREVRVGEVLSVYAGNVQRTVRVRALLEKRVGAPLVSQYLEDLTPPAEYEKAREAQRHAAAVFPPGAGRPTKKQRRMLEQWLEETQD